MVTANIRCHRRIGIAGLSALALIGANHLRAEADTLSNNLSNTSDGYYAATPISLGGFGLAAEFGTGSSKYALNGITLLLQESSIGTATLDIYTDDGLGEPGSLVGALTTPSSYSTSALADTTFAGNGITLAANSNYWVVLTAKSGEFDWSSTADNTGTGIGFRDTWGYTDGVSWYTTGPSGLDVLQMNVQATAVPEPGAVALLATSSTLGTALLLRRRRAKG